MANQVISIPFWPGSLKCSESETPKFCTRTLLMIYLIFTTSADHTSIMSNYYGPTNNKYTPHINRKLPNFCKSTYLFCILILIFWQIFLPAKVMEEDIIIWRRKAVSMKENLRQKRAKSCGIVTIKLLPRSYLDKKKSSRHCIKVLRLVW